jgi:hypothetical protein
MFFSLKRLQPAQKWLLFSPFCHCAKQFSFSTHLHTRGLLIIVCHIEYKSTSLTGEQKVIKCKNISDIVTRKYYKKMISHHFNEKPHNNIIPYSLLLWHVGFCWLIKWRFGRMKITSRYVIFMVQLTDPSNRNSLTMSLYDTF